jgi:antirestriction protein ArdC
MNIHAAISDRILKQLEHRKIPWRKTWIIGMPKSLITGREYRATKSCC